MNRGRNANKPTYSADNVRRAIDAINTRGISVRKAATSYGIPRSTLHDKLMNKVPIEFKKDPPPILSHEEEQKLSLWAIQMSQIGYGRTREQLLDTLAKERAMVTKEKIDQWFDSLSEYLNQNADMQLLSKPSRIFNADESGFPLCPKSGKVLAEKGCQNVYNFSSSDKSQVTVLACASAAGTYVTPMIVYPGSRFHYNPLEGFESAVLGRSESGWMDSELFASWLHTVFIPHINRCAVKKPVVLFVDGHSTHLTLDACNACIDNNIILYCLPSHASHVIQPLDLSVFLIE
ncbi:MFS-type transporter clz9-like, partial [Haliotis rubra]|uniref:MFS-type transporter clz9-like n=1 Tax=Haliotis rubra TaxID=36100 RepID=UPI001EE5B45D